MTDICPACEKGLLAPQVQEESFAYSGVELPVSGVEFSLCPVCGEEVVLPNQARRNSLLFADAKRRHDQLLTSDQIASIREIWGLTQQQAASLLGGGQNAFSKYERGEVIQSRSMDLLLRAYNEVPQLRAYLSGSLSALTRCTFETLNIERSISSEHFAGWFEQLGAAADIPGMPDWEEAYACDVAMISAAPRVIPAQPTASHTAQILGLGRQWGTRARPAPSWTEEDRTYVTH